MHQHKCPKCNDQFVCGRPADVCFETFVTCDDCFWRKDLFVFLLAFLLAAVAGAMTIYLFWELRG